MVIRRTIQEYTRRELLRKKGVKLVKDFFKEYIFYGGVIPMKPFIDFMHKRDNHVIDKWDKLELRQMIPINR